MRMSLASQVGLAVLGSIVPDGQGVGRVGQATLRPLQVDASSLAAPSAAALLPIHLHACCIPLRWVTGWTPGQAGLGMAYFGSHLGRAEAKTCEVQVTPCPWPHASAVIRSHQRQWRD